MLSNVAIAPAKPCLGSTSAEPSRFSFGTRQFSKMIVAVSEARMPSLCSSRSTRMPGVPFATTNDLIAARPSSLSSVAQTTMWSARSPEVTKIFSPLRTYSSPSRTAVVLMLAESEPVPGSVIAIAGPDAVEARELLVVGDAAIAELPRPWRGMESSRPTSPQHISWIDITEARLAPFLFAPSSSPSSRRTPAAPAPSDAPDSASPSIIAASMSSSLGYSCSARSYLREIGRSMFIATWWAWPTRVRNFFGSSRLMASDEHRTFHDADGPEVAVPPLHRVLLDEPVAAEQLHAVEADPHAVVGAALRASATSLAKSLPAAARPAAL